MYAKVIRISYVKFRCNTRRLQLYKIFKITRDSFLGHSVDAARHSKPNTLQQVFEVLSFGLDAGPQSSLPFVYCRMTPMGEFDSMTLKPMTVYYKTLIYYS